MNYKFKLGDFVKHATAMRNNARRLIVIGVGSITDQSGTMAVYMVSFERETFVARDDTFGRAFLNENELEFFAIPQIPQP